MFATVACLAWFACPIAAHSNTVAVGAIANDEIVTAYEKSQGFTITGIAGEQEGNAVEVTITDPDDPNTILKEWNTTTTSTSLNAAAWWWTVSVESDASYITHDTTLTVTAVSTFNGNDVSGSKDFYVNLSPKAPENLKATKGDDRKTTLTWNDPGDETIITKYQYSLDGGDFNDISGSDDETTTYTVTGLTNGTEHTLAVRAVNDSASGATATKKATPLWPAPTGLVATPGQGRVTLEWTNGDDLIQNYYIVTTGGVIPVTIFRPPDSGSKSTRIIYPLTNGTRYTFKVRAQHGHESTVTATPVSMPAPEPLNATQGDDRQTTLTWNDPGDNTISRYQVSIDGGDFNDISGSDDETTTHIVTGLTNGTEYELAVRAVNYFGYGAASTVDAIPLWPAPTNLVATPDDRRIYLEWDRNPGITYYRVDVLGGSSVYVPSGSESKTIATIDQLENDTKYTFTVQATQDSEPGSAVISKPSLSVDATPKLTVPSAPTGLSATPSNGQATLSWDDPGNITITKYQYQYRSDGGDFDDDDYNDISDSDDETTTYTVPSLTNDTRYTFAVRAVNNSGSSPFTTTTATPVGDAPTASDKTVSMDEDATYTFAETIFGFTSVKSDAKLDRVKITALPGRGTLSFNSTAITRVATPRQVKKTELDDNNLTYTPPTNENGDAFATFAFKVNDGVADSETAYTITINVDAVDDPLTGSDKTVTMDEDETYIFAATDFSFSDVDAKLNHVKITALPEQGKGMLAVGETTITSVSPPQEVTKTQLDTGQFEYTPPADKNGAAFATFTFQVNDGVADSEIYTITIDVDAVNDLPMAVADTAETSKDIAISIGVLDNDTDVDAMTDLRVVDVGLPDNGSAVINSNETSITYTPNLNFIGDDEFAYSVTDETATVSIPVNVSVLDNGSNANLSDLTISPGMLENFAATTTSYDVTVAAESVKVTPTAAEGGATITVNNEDVSSGEDSQDINLIEDGTTIITVTVTSRDANITQDYTINVFRPRLLVSYQEDSYTATEGGETVTVTVELSQGWSEDLAIPIRVTQSEATETDDYTVEELGEWDAQAGTGTLTFLAEETEQTFTITANLDGDGEDETVALGFVVEELPAVVTAGEPASATVTLKDKGLVELKVSFEQAEYQAIEVHQADIKVTMSPAADRRVEIPLVMTPEGGATVEDYSGVPAKLVFEKGESQETISVEALADEVNDGEGIVLSFGELPEAVNAGDFSSTRIQFRRQRTAEWFSRTLEAMLAVTARSMGESAQTAIEGRFERRRLEAAGGALPGSDNSVTNSDQGKSVQIGSESLEDADRRRTEIPVVQSEWGVDKTGLVMGSTPASGIRSQEISLAGASFEMPLGGHEKGNRKSWVPVLWGEGDLQHFNGDLTRIEMDYRGDLEAAHVGLDFYPNDQMLAGLSFMRSWGNIDYTDDGIDGVFGSRMDTVHPYLYWQPSERVSVWGIGGLGRGQVDVEEPGRTHDFDADFRMFAAGVRTVLNTRGNNEWGLRADAFTAQLETDASEDIVRVSGEAHRGRLVLEWVHDRELSVGRHLSLKIEAGGRWDGGDADRGAGVETGFRLGYLDANRGLDMALYGRGLVVHESDYRDWGVGVQAGWDPGEKQRGFRVSVMSSLNQDGGGRTTLWDNADAVMRSAGTGALGPDSRFRLESEVAYGGLKVPNLPGLLTPYSRLRWAGQGRELVLGTAWSRSAALPAMLELEAMRRENLTGPAYVGVFLRVSISF